MTVSSFTETHFRYYDLQEVGLAGVPQSTPTQDWLQNVPDSSLEFNKNMRAFISGFSGLSEA